MTKIKIIGDPGEQSVEILKKWLKKSLNKFGLNPGEIYLIFTTDVENEVSTIHQKYLKGYEYLSEEERGLLKKELKMIKAGYYDKEIRKEGVPPIITVKKDASISEIDILDEIAHMAEDEEGWVKIKKDAHHLLFKEFLSIFTINVHLYLLAQSLRRKIDDFFSSEIMCKHTLATKVLAERKNLLNKWVEEFSQEKINSSIQKFGDIMDSAFLTTLPPSYPEKQMAEIELEKMVINYVYRMSMEPLYRKMKSRVSKLESPPRVSNIYKVSSEILELAQEYLQQ